MKLIETIYELLIEAAPEQIYQKFYSDIDRDMFIRIISLDPASKVDGNKEGDIKKIGKYSKLLLKMFKEGNLKPEDFPKAKDYLTLVYKHQVPVDMNAIKSLGDLFTKVEKYYSSETSNVYDLIGLLSKDEYEVLLSGEKWIIYTPKSEKAAAYLGTGTEWCTAWGPYSTNTNYRDRKNHFSHHNGRGSLYVMINRENPTDKYQFHFETEQFMDKNDRKIDTGQFFENHPEVTEYFYPSLYDDTEVDSNELDKLKYLGPKQTDKLVERAIGDSDNPLVRLLVSEDGDELIESLQTNFINDDNLESIEWNFRENIIEFQLHNVDDSDLSQCSDTSRQYTYDSDAYADHSENLRSDITEMGDDDWYEDHIGSLLKEYYEKVVVLPGVDSYEKYRELMDGYWDDLIGDYADEYAYLNEDSVRTASQTELNNIERLIRVNETFIGISPAQMALFIQKEGITELTDLDSFFGAFVSFHNLDFEYENPMWNMNMEYPTLKEMESHFEGYTTKLEEELSQSPECLEGKDKLIEVRKKFFGGGNNYSREDLRIELRSGFDCETKTVNIVMNSLDKSNENVQNWQRYSGKVDLDRLVAYVTNEKLFERKN